MLKAIASALALASLAAAQTTVTLHSSVDGSAQPYALYVPKSFDPARKYPLVISLHEEESNHLANLRRVFGVANRYGETTLQTLTTMPTVRDAGYLVACP